jgi:rhodanese-related sulfurtransferase
VSAYANDYNYVSKDKFKSWLESGNDILICDIQPQKNFEKHHFKNAMETNAYPAKTEKDLKKLKKVVKKYKKTGKKIAIICPRGGGGAKRTYDHLKSRNIPEAMLVILEGGAEGWPYEELVVKKQ